MSNKKQYSFEMGEKRVLLFCNKHLEKELEFFVRILEHCEPVNEYDSGWYMVSLQAKASNHPDDYKKIYAFQLLSILP